MKEFQSNKKNLPEKKKIKNCNYTCSFSPNEEQDAIGDIPDENFEPNEMEDQTAKEFLDRVISDYNIYFKTNFSTDGNKFQNYYKDLSERVKEKK